MTKKKPGALSPAALAKRAAAEQRERVYAAARVVVYARCKGCCELCGRKMYVETMHAHHRLLRSAGGPDCPSNLMGLCYRCHHVQVHAHPERAYKNGWLISRYDDRVPADCPLVMGDGIYVLSVTGEVVAYSLV